MKLTVDSKVASDAHMPATSPRPEPMPHLLQFLGLSIEPALWFPLQRLGENVGVPVEAICKARDPYSRRDVVLSGK